MPAHPLNKFSVKILLILLVPLFHIGCNVVKNVPASEYLLTENTIYVNGEETKQNNLYNYLTLDPNQKLLGYPVRLGVYNLSKDSADVKYAQKLNENPTKKKWLRRLLSKKQVNRIAARKKNFNNWLKNAGEAPAIITNAQLQKGQKRLEAYFWNRGWFNVSSEFEIIPLDTVQAKVAYHMTTKKPYIIDTINININAPVADSIYQKIQPKSFVKTKKQYNTDKLEAERNRITKSFRNKGLFHFQRDYIKFDADTINTQNKINLTLNINNRPVSNNDSTSFIPFRVHPISRVKIYTDENNRLQTNGKIADSVNYQGFELYSYKKMRFKPKALTNAVFTVPGEVYQDSLRTLTYNSLNNLGVFKYPTITLAEDPDDPKNEALIATILLNARKKYAIGFDFDVSTSAIQDIGLGFGGSLKIRNVFRRAETFEISAYGSIGASDDLADNSDRFFNISDLGIDAKLSFPRILSPIKIKRLQKKSNSPKTDAAIGLSRQRNIGLDKESVNASFLYQWKPNIGLTKELNLFNLQFVRNLNPDNYFNVYTNSYNTLNDVAQDILAVDDPLFNDDNNLNIDDGSADLFISNAVAGNFDDVISADQIDDVNSVAERKARLTEDNLILSSSYSLIKDTRSNLYDEDFYRLRFKVESAGLSLNAVAELSDSVLNENESLELFNVEYSQFIKFETEYIKRWRIDRRNILAFRAFGGIAIPYGNSNSIPFSQSYFGGGSNDLRAWTAYSLGPGSSGGINDFNEANFKLLFNIEHRFDVLGALKGALFTDIGNIWNILDQFKDDEPVSFNSLRDLDELAIGVGTGLRYDFSFFVLRLDVAWKLYNPDQDLEKKWFRELNFANTVFNVGINYPF